MAIYQRQQDLKRRLLRDIEELKTEPYPNIEFHVADKDIYQACLIVHTEVWGPLHMTVHFGLEYPLQPPQIQMDSHIDHPNVFDSGYICASILNTTEGYTPAYTLKGIAIQMLSFFVSENLEQDHGGGQVNLAEYHTRGSSRYGPYFSRSLGLSRCSDCGFSTAAPELDDGRTLDLAAPLNRAEAPTQSSSPKNRRAIEIANLPSEILLLVCNELDTQDLFRFAEAWSRIGKVITTYDVVRVRELQCFFSKRGFDDTRLGIGVAITRKGKLGTISSEFDLLSYEGFHHGIRRSVHGIPFHYWLPLPISRKHWLKVKDIASPSLREIKMAASLGTSPDVKVIYHFMNDVVVNLNSQASSLLSSESHSGYYRRETEMSARKSTLKHASEKAIEAYFHLFHLLLCLATSDRSIVEAANAHVQKFLNGHTSKSDCPNLGHLMIDLLISDIDVTPTLARALIKEAVTRNVVWMLSANGGNMPELAYLEPSNTISKYRLEKTFKASRTSYRLLMFQNLFRRTVRPSRDAISHLQNKPATKPSTSLTFAQCIAASAPPNPSTRNILEQLRDSLFDRHGGPPPGAAARLAGEIKRLHNINSFPQFLVEMGVPVPTASLFSQVLRQAVSGSMEMGYSRWALTQEEALWLRIQKEPDVEEGGIQAVVPKYRAENRNWFPGRR
ncbi:MAG: hypothetical protein Q9227_003854 [Pyrenula ochraceoflavens]